MKRLHKLTVLFLAALAPAAALADEPAHPLKPLLWKVEGKGLAKPSWLFGTIHVGEGPVGKLHPAAAKALDGADAVYTEIPMDPATQLGMAAQFIRTDGKTLGESIGEEMSKQLDAELKAIQPELDAAVLQPLKTWAVAVTLPMLELQLGGSKPLDMIVWEAAAEAGKTTGSLEQAKDQVALFDGFKEEEQVILLGETLRLQKEGRAKGEDPVAELVKAYVAGDAAKVEAEMDKHLAEIAKSEHKELGEKLFKKLLDDRNAGMAKVIVGKLAAEPERSHFFAVGAAHYIGRANIGELLGKEGYRVTRVAE